MVNFFQDLLLSSARKFLGFGPILNGLQLLLEVNCYLSLNIAQLSIHH
jgi:hypothetical protein